MKLNVHYFTTKFIAIRSGYSELEAQTIAATCQFINDNYQPAPLYLPKELVSQAIIDRELCQYDAARGQYKIPLVLTAIEDENNAAALKDVTNQKEIFIPFYYFADTVLVDDEANEDYSVTPIATLQTSKRFDRLFHRASQYFRAEVQNDGEQLQAARLQALRRLGVLLHIVSDSFSFTPFNGYTSDSNAWRIVEVKDTRTFKNVTEQYNPSKYGGYPAVGKYRTSTVSEDYNRQFILKLDDSGKSFTRINNDNYAKAAYAIYTFLNNFVGKDPSLPNWRDNILPLLLKCWNTEQSSYEELKKHWGAQTGLNYDYDPSIVRQGIVNYDKQLPPDQQGYFDFLLTLQDIKDAVFVKLEEADKLLTVDGGNVDAIKFDVSQPKFLGQSYEMKISTAFPTKLAAIGMTITIFNTETQELIHSATYRYKNTSTFDEKVELSIPEQSQKLLAKVDFVWSEGRASKKKSFKHNYDIVGNSDLVAELLLNHPLSNNARDTIQIVNGTESVSADYSFPKNSQYISQEGEALIDLYVPVDLQIKLIDGYIVNDNSNLKITLTTPSGQEYKYCNNKKYITIKQDQTTGLLNINAVEEWKNRLSVKSFDSSIARLKLAISIELEVISEQEDGYREIVVDTSSNSSLITDIEYLWNN